MSSATFTRHHSSQPGELALGELFLSLHPSDVSGVPGVRVDDAKSLDGSELVAAVHLPVAAGHPDDCGGLHAREEAATGDQDTRRIFEECFAFCLVFFEEVRCDGEVLLPEPIFNCF